MISPEFNLAEFVDTIKNWDKHIIQSLAESEAREAEKISEIKGYGQDYVEALTGFIYFLRFQQKPFGVKQEHFDMFQPVCEKLVEKKQLSSDVLRMFDV